MPVIFVILTFSLWIIVIIAKKGFRIIAVSTLLLFISIAWLVFWNTPTHIKITDKDKSAVTVEMNGNFLPVDQDQTNQLVSLLSSMELKRSSASPYEVMMYGGSTSTIILYGEGVKNEPVNIYILKDRPRESYVEIKRKKYIIQKPEVIQKNLNTISQSFEDAEAAKLENQIEITGFSAEKSIAGDDGKPIAGDDRKSQLGFKFKIEYSLSDPSRIEETQKLGFTIEYPESYAKVIGADGYSDERIYEISSKSPAQGNGIFRVYPETISEAAINKLTQTKSKFIINIFINEKQIKRAEVYSTPADPGGIKAQIDYKKEPAEMQNYTKLFQQAMPNAEIVGKIMADMDGDNKDEFVVIFNDLTYKTKSNFCIMKNKAANAINLVPGSGRYAFAEGESSLRIVENPVRARVLLKDTKSKKVIAYEITVAVDENTGNRSLNIQKFEQ